MIDTVVELLPALLGIALGYVLRLRGVADRRDADFTFRLIINVFLPALAFAFHPRLEADVPAGRGRPPQPAQIPLPLVVR